MCCCRSSTAWALMGAALQHIVPQHLGCQLARSLSCQQAVSLLLWHSMSAAAQFCSHSGCLAGIQLRAASSAELARQLARHCACCLKFPKTALSSLLSSQLGALRLAAAQFESGLARFHIWLLLPAPAVSDSFRPTWPTGLKPVRLWVRVIVLVDWWHDDGDDESIWWGSPGVTQRCW